MAINKLTFSDLSRMLDRGSSPIGWALGDSSRTFIREEEPDSSGPATANIISHLKMFDVSFHDENRTQTSILVATSAPHSQWSGIRR